MEINKEKELQETKLKLKEEEYKLRWSACNHLVVISPQII